MGGPTPPDFREVLPYSALAAGYDVVMEHVAYEAWAAYVHDLLQRFHPRARTVLELGCGTGTFALALQAVGAYQYAGTDHSPQMIRIARAKAALEGAPIQFAVADFTRFRAGSPVDIVILLYDGLNYLLEEDQARAFLRHAYEALRPGGVLLFDQSTPANSINNEAFFEDEGEAGAFAYVRHSVYDRERKLHTTIFDLTVEGEYFHERHVQRAYEMAEIQALIRETPFETLAVFDSLTEAPADEASERIHWVLRKAPPTAVTP